MLLMGLIRETSFDEEQISRFAVHKDSKTLIVCSLFPKRAGNPCQPGNWACKHFLVSVKKIMSPNVVA